MREPRPRTVGGMKPLGSQTRAPALSSTLITEPAEKSPMLTGELSGGPFWRGLRVQCQHLKDPRSAPHRKHLRELDERGWTASCPVPSDHFTGLICSQD